MSASLPVLLVSPNVDSFPAITSREVDQLRQARKLFDAGFYDHALLDIWNAAVHNLRRRCEAYGMDLFESVAKDEAGRKKYNKDGDSISERWAGVDDLVVISCCTKLGLLNKKAGKALEMINWMRNHASPAHDSENKVEHGDVIALSLLLQHNLFDSPLPDPGHSVSGLFDPIKTSKLDSDQMSILQDQVAALGVADIKVAFGFLLDLLCKGQEPALSNAASIFPVLWKRSSEDLRKTAGLRYQTYKISPQEDTSADSSAASRLLDFLVAVQGVRYIPDGSRAVLYRHAAKALAKAKDASYGWSQEVDAAKTLEQFGPYVPNNAFGEVYQEVIATWCGNHWGRSSAHEHLTEYVESLNTSQVRQLAELFVSNDRANAELFQAKPKAFAVELLLHLKSKLTIQAHLTELDAVIAEVKSM
ncbi:hypothetical protein ACFPN2_09690 [Steroidobacter flavus]|uniref:Uncharacterized protein n=1 Tax=Steroidobacter flavus TaxID=1842136 RepID=A0ABV8SPE8_9GAMM